jgi:hypothetical protein
MQAVETRNRLQAAASILSAGLVAPSDMVGGSNAGLILSMTTKAGMLLQPDRPATALDREFVYEAFQQGGINGHISSTYTELTDTLRVSYVMAVDLNAPYYLSIGELGYQPQDVLVYFEKNSTSGVLPFDAQHTLPVAACQELNFGFYTVLPVLPNGWAFAGEINKWVAISRTRFSAFSFTDDTIGVMVDGIDGEVVSLSFVNPSGSILTFSCTMADANRLYAVIDVTTSQLTCNTVN